MKSRPMIFLGFALLAMSPCVLRAQEKKPNPPATLQELAKQVIAALKREDYKGLQQLAIHPDQFATLQRTADKDDIAQYKEYYQELPSLGKRYQRHLESNGFFKSDAKIKLTVRPGEDTADRSTGVLAEAGDFKIELIDQAVRLGKTWYVLRLVTGRDERKLPELK